MSIRSSLKGLVAVSLFTASIASAATDGQVDLSGSVSSTLAMTVTPTLEASALDLMNGEQIVKVADVATSTNNESGLTLTVTSGSLSKAGGTSIAYKVMTVADAGSAPLIGAFTVASGSDHTPASTAAGAFDRDLYIAYTPATLQDPGDYAGQIDLSVSDN